MRKNKVKYIYLEILCDKYNNFIESICHIRTHIQEKMKKPA